MEEISVDTIIIPRTSYTGWLLAELAIIMANLKEINV